MRPRSRSPLVERVGRGIALTSEGQQLLSYSRQILRLNDEAWLRLTHQAFEGQVILGVPRIWSFLIVPSIMPIRWRFSARQRAVAVICYPQA